MKLMKDKRGMTEILSFVVLAPLLLIMFLGMAQLAVMGVSQIVVQQAAFSAARAAAENPDDYKNAAISATGSFGSRIFFAWNDKTTSVDVSAGSTEPGDPVTVRVSYKYPKFAFYTDFLNRSNSDSVTGTATQDFSAQP